MAQFGIPIVLQVTGSLELEEEEEATILVEKLRSEAEVPGPAASALKGEAI